MTRRSVSRRSFHVARFPALALAAALTALSAFAEDSAPGESIAGRLKEIFDFNRNGVVKIESTDPHGHIEGTGFYADSSGTIYTGLDVIGDGTNITVVQGLRKLPARLQVVDPRTGIAILKVDTTTPFLPIGDSSKVDVYTPVIAIGYPYDKQATWNAGLVASLDKQFLNHYLKTTHFRATLPVEPGFGGSPVLNLKGEVIGIVVAGIEGNAGCYVLPINAAEKARTDFNRFGQLRPGWVGITVEPNEDTSLPSTARIAAMQPEAPASSAGIRKGDILLRVGDIAIHSPEDVFDASFFLTAGDETSVTVLRNGTEQKFTVRAAESPASAGLAEHPELPVDTSIRLETSVTPAPER